MGEVQNYMPISKFYFSSFSRFLGIACAALIPVVPAVSSTIDVSTDGAAPWTVSVPGEGIANATPYILVRGMSTDVLAVTSTSDSNGTFVAGGSSSSFDGFWTGNLHFSLPSNATNVALNFSSLFGDDRTVLELNGTVISSAALGAANGTMVFTDGGPNNSFNFAGSNPSGSAANGFNLGGTNTLTLIVNNTEGGAFGSPRAPTGFSETFVGLVGSVSYDLGSSTGPTVPEPWSGALAAFGLAGLLALRKLRRFAR